MTKSLYDPEVEKRGIEIGRNMGIIEGRQLGIAEGKNIGIAEGKNIGIAEGLEVATKEHIKGLLHLLDDKAISEALVVDIELVKQIRRENIN